MNLNLKFSDFINEKYNDGDLKILFDLAKTFSDPYDFDDYLNWNKQGHNRDLSFLRERFDRLNRGNRLTGNNIVTIYRTGDQPIRWGDYVYIDYESVHNSFNAGQGEKIYKKNVVASDIVETSVTGEYYYSPKDIAEIGEDLIDLWNHVKGIKKSVPKKDNMDMDDRVKSFKSDLKQITGMYQDFSDFESKAFDLSLIHNVPFEDYEEFFEKNNLENFNTNEVAWLYFLHYTYGGKMKLDSWGNDSRMGVKFYDVIEKAKEQGLVEIKDEIAYSSEEVKDIVKSVFYEDNLEDVLKISNTLTDTKGYPIKNIPMDLYLKENPDKEEIIDKVRDNIHHWFNYASPKYLNKLKKHERLFYNKYKLIQYFNLIPDTINIYRGIKDRYDTDHNSTLTSWTLDYEEAVRFASYRFTGGMQFKPTYSEKGFILTAEVSIKDIFFVVGGEESEIIMKGKVPVKDVKEIDPIDYHKNTNESNTDVVSFEQYKKIYESKENKKIILYHGSDFKFDKLKYIPKKEGHNAFGDGIYLVDNFKEAKKYGKYVYKCEVLLKNTFNIDENLQKWIDLTEKYDDYTSVLKKQGYDSICVEKSWENIFVVFYPSSIKILEINE